MALNEAFSVGKILAFPRTTSRADQVNIINSAATPEGVSVMNGINSFSVINKMILFLKNQLSTDCGHEKNGNQHLLFRWVIIAIYKLYFSENINILISHVTPQKTLNFFS